jgi:hypothetical protein
VTTTLAPRSAYPAAVEALLPQARKLAEELGGTPSQNRLKNELKVGRDKARAVLEALTSEPDPAAGAVAEFAPAADLVPVPDPIPVPDVPVLAPVPATVETDAESEVFAQVTDAVDPGTEIVAEQVSADAAVAEVKRLRRLAMGTRAVFTLGVAASLAGNVLHAEGGYISQIISAWSPLALLLAVELLTRIPVRAGFASFVRLAATAVIAGIAAWISYWHMAGVAAEYGESGSAAYLLPMSVDGLIVVASISLVEIGGRIRHLRGLRS